MQADLQQVRKLVRAVTGNNTLGRDELFFDVCDRNSDIIPCSHTCTFTLELSCDYIDQKHFDEKLEWFINESLAGSGFQNK